MGNKKWPLNNLKKMKVNLTTKRKEIRSDMYIGQIEDTKDTIFVIKSEDWKKRVEIKISRENTEILKYILNNLK